jgi:cytochrome c oxidase subunit 3
MRRRHLSDVDTTLPVHPPGFAHQFDNPVQQRDAAVFGMWVFLVTEIMFFGGLFAGYTVYRTMYPHAFAIASQYSDVTMGAVNTAVLICSSLTMVLAVQSAELGRNRALILYLVATIFFGVIFLLVKAYEYHAKWEEQVVPGFNFHVHSAEAPQIQLLMLFYFVMTGMHAIHMVIGVGLLSYLIWRASKGEFSPAYYNPVDNIGLYWHFVDIVWIFLFPMLYLIGAHLPKLIPEVH